MQAGLTFPFDDDGDVLRSLQSKGVDLSKARDIDFYCYVPVREAAAGIIAAMSGLGLECELFEYDGSGRPEERLSVYGTIHMVPDYDDLIRMQIDLNEVLARYGTYCDGWGTLADPAERG